MNQNEIAITYPVFIFLRNASKPISTRIQSKTKKGKGVGGGGEVICRHKKKSQLNMQYNKTGKKDNVRGSGRD